MMNSKEFLSHSRASGANKVIITIPSELLVKYDIPKKYGIRVESELKEESGMHEELFILSENGKDIHTWKNVFMVTSMSTVTARETIMISIKEFIKERENVNKRP